MLLTALLLVGATPACKPDIPDDLVLRCHPDGYTIAVSESANQMMVFEHWRCRRMTPT